MDKEKREGGRGARRAQPTLTVCDDCGWMESRVEGSAGDVRHRTCPECEATLSLLVDSTDPGLSSQEAAVLERIEHRLASRQAHLDRFEKTMLKDVEQLPEIDGPGFLLTWDVDIPDVGEAQNEIRLGQRVIWRELAHWGDHERFAAIAAILSDKYADRLEDLVPTRQAEIVLYGDSLGALHYVDAVRRELRSRFRRFRETGAQASA